MSHDGRLALAYHEHYIVDGGRARVILYALVTPADVMENQPMRDLLWRVRFRWRLRPRRAIGDTTYGTADNIRALEEAGIHAYVPLPAFDHWTPFLGTSRFAHDAERDEYRCPQGQRLRRWKAEHTEEVIVYRADAATCNTCPLKAACTASPRGRQVRRSFHAEYLDRVRGYDGTPAFEKAMRKQWHGLRRCRLRGLFRVNCDAVLIATGQNLKRLLSASGWGRRLALCGYLIAASAAKRLCQRRL